MTLSHGHKEGAALVESCLVIALLCLILFGILQMVYVVAAQNVINYSAVATARSAAVGMNDFMLHKVSRYTTIPTAGPVRVPSGFGGVRPEGESLGAQLLNAVSPQNDPRSALGQYEAGVYQSYHLASPSVYMDMLDYDNWQREETAVSFTVAEDSKLDMLHVEVKQRVPFTLPFSRVFLGHLPTAQVERGGELGAYPAKEMSAQVTIEDHARLYMGPRE